MNLLEALKPLASAVDRALPFVPIINGPSNGTTIEVNGQRYTNLCSSNYLGLGNDPRLVAAVKGAVDRYGISTNGSPLVTGRIRITVDLEEELARFKGTPSAITFTSGFATNAGVLPAILRPMLARLFPHKSSRAEKVVFADQEVHASIRHGLDTADVRVVNFRHNDLDDLERKLQASLVPLKLIAVDGLYSVSGDFAPLPELLTFCEKYNAVLFNDDAHAIGVIGKYGRGTAEYFGVEHHPLLIEMGTMSKAFGSEGGYVVCEKWLGDYLRPGADTYLFSAALKASSAAAALKALKIVQTEERHHRVLENADYVRNRLKHMGFDTGVSCAQIVPIWLKEEDAAMLLERQLFEAGFFIKTLTFPAAAKGHPCLRIFINYHHDRVLHLDPFLDTLSHLIDPTAAPLLRAG